jgi:hypothetical protein
VRALFEFCLEVVYDIIKMPIPMHMQNSKEAIAKIDLS